MSDQPSPPFASVVLDALASHGLRPLADTSVGQLRAQVNDLYRYEIRRLRGRLLSGECPKASYAEAVRALRLRYLLLSLPKDQWRVR